MTVMTARMRLGEVRDEFQSEPQSVKEYCLRCEETCKISSDLEAAISAFQFPNLAGLDEYNTVMDECLRFMKEGLNKYDLEGVSTNEGEFYKELIPDFIRNVELRLKDFAAMVEPAPVLN